MTLPSCLHRRRRRHNRDGSAPGCVQTGVWVRTQISDKHSVCSWTFAKTRVTPVRIAKHITDYSYGRPLLLLDKTYSVSCTINLVALIKTVLHMNFMLYVSFQLYYSYDFKMCISLIHFMYKSYSSLI